AFAPLEHQVALLRRRDSCLVVGAYDVRSDTLFARDSLQAALVLARDERTVPVIERRPDARASDVIVAKADCAPQLVSLELFAPARRHVARARYGVGPPRLGTARVAGSPGAARVHGREGAGARPLGPIARPVSHRARGARAQGAAGQRGARHHRARAVRVRGLRYHGLA